MAAFHFRRLRDVNGTWSRTVTVGGCFSHVVPYAEGGDEYDHREHYPQDQIFEDTLGV
jgi:hypothetical protein